MSGTPTQDTPTRVIDNPMPHRLPDGDNATPLESIGATATDKLVIIMVGLPACGKTHIAHRIRRFLNFFHDIPCSIFNVGEYRRKYCGVQLPASFYSIHNDEGQAARKKACDAALNDLVGYMGKPGVRVGILDATNSTHERRMHIKNTLTASKVGVKVMCIESVCNDVKILEENIRTVKLNTPDYRDKDPVESVKDFVQRRENYKEGYEGVDDKDGPHIIILDCKKFVINSVRGYLPLKVVHFVMNLHTHGRTFYFTRHGQSEYNLLGKIGGDSGLSKSGVEYAKRLAKYAEENIALNSSGESVPSRLWTSTLSRTKETAKYISHPTLSVELEDNVSTVSAAAPSNSHDWVQLRLMSRRNLDELYAGKCDGMTYKEIEEVYPDEFAARQDDKLAYRYPRGESYMDVILRLEPLAHEMERAREPILIIGHQGILRILYAYFMGLKREDAPYVSIPLNHVLKLTPHAYGCHEEKVCLLDKEEMRTISDSDGQDEPVTSMPVKGARGNLNKEMEGRVLKDHEEILNAPSC